MTEHHDTHSTDADTPRCSLSPGALDDRVGAWRSLAARALHREIGEGQVRATYPNRPEIARRLAQLIDAEKECCPFLHFDVEVRGAVIEVELRYPPGVGPLLDAAVDASPDQGTPPSTTRVVPVV